jgi:tripartite-type tricarboxylate transporter receptor subunit TctC
MEERMKMKKIVCVAAVFMALAGGLFAGGGGEYPSRNIEAIVGYSAGGSTDLGTRGLFEAASSELPSGVNFVVSNVVGDAGLIGFNKFLQARPDGYTLMAANIDIAINYAIGRTKISIDDWIPVGCAFYDPYGLIVGNSPNYKTFKEFIDYAKSHPGQVTMGHSGLGGTPQILTTAIEKHFGVSFKYVPYNSSADCAVAIVAGDIEGSVSQATPALSQIKAGNIRLLTMFTDERSGLWPDTPVAKEYYPDFDNKFVAWGFVAVPKGTPPEIIKYLEGVFDRARVKPEYKQIVTNLNQDVAPINSPDMAAFIKGQYDLYAELCKDMQIK